MRKIKEILIISLIIWTGSLMGQTKMDNTNCVPKFDSIANRTIYLIVDSMPEFPGGNDSLIKFIQTNIK